MGTFRLLTSGEQDPGGADGEAERAEKPNPGLLSGGAKYAILPSAGEIANRCCKGQEYISGALYNPPVESRVELHLGHFGTPDRCPRSGSPGSSARPPRTFLEESRRLGQFALSFGFL